MFWIVPIESDLFILTELAKRVKNFYCKVYHLPPSKTILQGEKNLRSTKVKQNQDLIFSTE